MSFDIMCLKCKCYYKAESASVEIRLSDREFVIYFCPSCTNEFHQNIVKELQGKKLI